MRRTIVYLIATYCFFNFLFTTCTGSRGPGNTARYNYNTRNSYSPLFLDSASMEKFIQEHSISDSLARRLRDFYNTRKFYQYAWFFNDGIADYAATFLQMLDNYIAYSGDSTLYNPKLQQLQDSIK